MLADTLESASFQLLYDLRRKVLLNIVCRCHCWSQSFLSLLCEKKTDVGCWSFVVLVGGSCYSLFSCRSRKDLKSPFPALCFLFCLGNHIFSPPSVLSSPPPPPDVTQTTVSALGHRPSRHTSLVSLSPSSPSSNIQR